MSTVINYNTKIGDFTTKPVMWSGSKSVHVTFRNHLNDEERTIDFVVVRNKSLFGVLRYLVLDISRTDGETLSGSDVYDMAEALNLGHSSLFDRMWADHMVTVESADHA